MFGLSYEKIETSAFGATNDLCLLLKWFLCFSNFDLYGFYPSVFYDILTICSAVLVPELSSTLLTLTLLLLLLVDVL